MNNTNQGNTRVTNGNGGNREKGCKAIPKSPTGLPELFRSLSDEKEQEVAYMLLDEERSTETYTEERSTKTYTVEKPQTEQVTIVQKWERWKPVKASRSSRVEEINLQNRKPSWKNASRKKHHPFSMDDLAPGSVL
jgi:hypothetical protein